MKDGKAGVKTYLVEVAPIGKAYQDTLSYFSSAKVDVGTLAKVPIRGKAVLSIVLKCTDARLAKSEIRHAGYLLKKIRVSDILNAGVSMETFEAIRKTAHYYSTPIGTLINTLVPKLLSDGARTFFKRDGTKQKKVEPQKKDPILLQMESEERFAQYRGLVRQAFARNSSVLLVVPTHLEIDKVREELSRGITEFVHTWSLSVSKKVVKESWTKALEEKHPILFITTPAGLLFPRRDIDTVILERENSRAYRTLTRPFIHFRKHLEFLAQESGKLLVLGDSVLSLETLWKSKTHEYSDNSLIRWHLPASPSRLVDAKSKQSETGHFEIFSRELQELIEKSIEEKAGIFLFGTRKGLAPTTVCGDCGTVLPCQNCGAPVVLHRRGEANVYVCHACGAHRESATTCSYCGSWKLVPLGIGTEEIYRRALALFPQVNIEILDKDHASTDSKAREIVKRFKEKGGILIGTELAFYHLDKVPYSAIVSIDSLLSIPDFGINERIFYIVSRMREVTGIESLIQTRNIGKQILAWASLGSAIDFYQNEIEDRKMLLYPPFSIFIKIVVPKGTHHDELAKLKKRFEWWHPDILRDSLVMRIPRESWPEEKLVRELALLGHQFLVKVDPESIL